jgi:hypothetical protein
MPMIKTLVITVIAICLNACVNVTSKPIEYREVVHDRITNHLEFGDNQNSIDVSEGEQIIPLKHPRFNIYFDTYQQN